MEHSSSDSVIFVKTIFFCAMECLRNVKFCELAGTLSSEQSATTWVIADNDYLPYLGYKGDFIARRKSGRRAVTDAKRTSLCYESVKFGVVANQTEYKGQPILNPEMIGPEDPKPVANAVRLVLFSLVIIIIIIIIINNNKFIL